MNKCNWVSENMLAHPPTIGLWMENNGEYKNFFVNMLYVSECILLNDEYI